MTIQIYMSHDFVRSQSVAKPVSATGYRSAAGVRCLSLAEENMIK